MTAPILLTSELLSKLWPGILTAKLPSSSAIRSPILVCISATISRLPRVRSRFRILLACGVVFAKRFTNGSRRYETVIRNFTLFSIWMEERTETTLQTSFS
ncbi:hypothetical protein BC938DRAFT_479284 [Jimgerdemannia flammicorona]|uniref:Uncharacterized protein n=1 Tax=Jimgerdemannia flammicorona TaxID=994334 RepID=A0A433QL51_9FUNG|nr:hypothetical protein BC938DRAFT_479284 [Jimgerdemannia flammicorona]